jgi:biopolymer transport protein ExbD
MILDNKLEHKRQRISLTPLIDVVFILLIFFVLETNFVKFGELLMPLPNEDDGAGAATPIETIEIQVFAADKIWIAGASVTVAALESYLSKRELGADTHVVLASHEDVNLQVLVSVIDILKMKQLQNIRLTAVE